MKEQNKEQVRDFWNRNVCHTKFIEEEQGTKQFFEKAEEIRYKYHYHIPPWLDEMAQVCGKDGKFLEIGCGMGTDALQMAKRGAQVTAIDLTEEGIRLAKDRFKLYGYRADIATGDAENLQFPDEQFDVVYSFGVLHHTPQTELTINEVHRVLKKGGHAYIMLYNRLSLNYLAHYITQTSFDSGKDGEKCPLEKAYSKSEIRQMFQKYASVDIKVDYLFGTGWGAVNKFIPTFLHRALGKMIGWHLMIRAQK
ncbi:class I SAM-dependent methyltransferase [candidate division KSB1 bacterium]|nr:class I SAM-dependent methyltransferase [candidate division KSB1 bacterium]